MYMDYGYIHIYDVRARTHNLSCCCYLLVHMHKNLIHIHGSKLHTHLRLKCLAPVTIPMHRRCVTRTFCEKFLSELREFSLCICSYPHMCDYFEAWYCRSLNNCTSCMYIHMRIYFIFRNKNWRKTISVDVLVK